MPKRDERDVKNNSSAGSKVQKNIFWNAIVLGMLGFEVNLKILTPEKECRALCGPAFLLLEKVGL